MQQLQQILRYREIEDQGTLFTVASNNTARYAETSERILGLHSFVIISRLLDNLVLNRSSVRASIVFCGFWHSLEELGDLNLSMTHPW